jgi:hypothetical protein
MKRDSLWVVDGKNPSEYVVYNVANMYGGVAPRTLTTCDIGFSVSGGTSATRNVCIWQTANNIMLWDGSVLYPISMDVESIFDQTSSLHIEPSMVSASTGFYDEALREYHWLWASTGNTSLNMEFVFDLIKKKWFQIDRGTGKYLQFGTPIIDANAEKYIYGFTDTGMAEYLENGTTFDGIPIQSTYWTGDVPILSWAEQSIVRNLKLICKSKNLTNSNISVSVYLEGRNIPDKVYTFSMKNGAYRIVKDNTISVNAGDAVFHSFKATVTTTNELIGFEPIGIVLLAERTRFDFS